MPNPGTLLETLGPWALVAIAAMVFVESGLLFPFLPGDSLLVAAGLLHVRLQLDIAVIALVGVAAAIAGDAVGYLIGRRFGTRMFGDDARILTTERLHETQAFFTRFGGRAVFLARFVPVVRTYTPLAAGSARYALRRFLPWNIAGALVWGIGVPLGGSFLGGFPFIADNIDILLTGVVVVTIAPVVVAALRRRRRARA